MPELENFFDGAKKARHGHVGHDELAERRRARTGRRPGAATVFVFLVVGLVITLAAAGLMHFTVQAFHEGRVPHAWTFFAAGAALWLVAAVVMAWPARKANR